MITRRNSVPGTICSIAAHEVTNVGHERSQLASMAEQAKQATGVRELIVLADRGRYEGQLGQIAALPCTILGTDRS